LSRCCSVRTNTTFPWQYGQWIAIGFARGLPSFLNLTAWSGGVSIGSSATGRGCLPRA